MLQNSQKHQDGVSDQEPVHTDPAAARGIDIGGSLRRRREDLNLELSSVATTLRIRREYLAALENNTIQGLMVDLITEIGKDAGFSVQVEPMQFSTLVASLTSSKIDIISAAMLATAARREVIDLSEKRSEIFQSTVAEPPQLNSRVVSDPEYAGASP